ncbi:ParB/RepB/Spo0J family partition protein [Chloroflexota bacterium]
MGVKNIEALVLNPIEEWYGEIVEIPTNLIKPDPENLRQEFDEADLIDLGKNMELIGQLDEITVFPVILDNKSWAGYFDLHDGERRWRAANLVKRDSLRAKIVPRPSDDELLYKRISRVLQTRSLSPEKKIAGLEKALIELDIFDKPKIWESYREKLGGGQEWPQLVRVLMLTPKVREMMNQDLINFTIAQSIGRLPIDKQNQIAEYVVVNKINGRFFSTQMVPYMLEYPNATPAQAFEHTRVGGWRQYTQSPYKRGEEPSVDQRVEKFLEVCVTWERAWEVLVHTGLVKDIEGDSNLEYRMSDAAHRITERASALAERISKRGKQDISIDRPQSSFLLHNGETKRLT